MTTHHTAPATTPAAGLKPEKMPGHWLLAKLGKRVLRPGGRELTDVVLDGLAITARDDVVEFAPGLGVTTQLILDRSPASYTGIERDPTAVDTVRAVLRGDQDRCQEATAQHSGLADASADVVTGEAFLTMQSSDTKQAIVAEAFRILRPGGRYGLHELSLRPDDLDETIQTEVADALSHSIHVGARPLTVGSWRSMLEAAGFEIRHERTADMALLEPRRVIADEGLGGALRIGFNLARDSAARRRVSAMRSVFRRYGDHIGAVGLVAVKSSTMD